MLTYHFDIRHKNDYTYNFCRTKAYYRDCRRNDHLVLNIKLGDLDVKSPDFNLNTELNRALKNFVELYASLLEGGGWNDLVDPDACKTLANIITLALPFEYKFAVFIDDYDHPYWATSAIAAELPEKRDEVVATLSHFFDALTYWTNDRDGVSMIFLAGTQQILTMVSQETWSITHDIVRKEDTDKLVGFCEEDVRQIADALDWSFPNLKMKELAEEFLSSEVAMKQLQGGAFWYKYSCRSVLGFFHQRPAEKVKEPAEIGLPHVSL
ncbi:hypothetical protein AAF712_006518 [Marasmius tenuissimus]|uniref:AAA-ATPase-like domain-containing protein n=1 Tax=Marasmius tenuissimus TaxID=585030 RepID=A0ABR2ZYQ7_9AGAR